MSVITYSIAINQALAKELERDTNVILYGQDVAVWGGIFRVTEGLLQRFGPDRVFDSPISAHVMVGAGVGAAIMGLRPVVELQFADFIFTAGDEVFLKAGMWGRIGRGARQGPLAIRAPSGGTRVLPRRPPRPATPFGH